MPAIVSGGQPERAALSTPRRGVATGTKVKSPPAPSPMSRRPYLFAGTLAVGCAAAYLAHLYTSGGAVRTLEAADAITVPLGRAAADISVRSAVADDNEENIRAWRYQLKKRLTQFDPLPTAEVEARLTGHQQSVILPSTSRLVRRYDTNQVASNSPIEDYHQQWSLPLAENGAMDAAGRWLLFGVFDGHSGFQCSRRLASELPKHIDRALAWAHTGSKDGVLFDAPVVAAVASILETSEATRVDPALLSDDPGAEHVIRAALTKGFITMDTELIEGSLQEAIKHPERMKEALLPAMAGSCGLVAALDTTRRQVSVACTGDSRAVLGSLDGSTGLWTATPLSADQTAHNVAELKRLYAEHPGEERTVISKGRILGSLMPTRAFGDARYKWPESIQRTIYPSQFPGRRATPPHYLTPPYVTATPVVTDRPLSPRDKFIVVASDGLYDELSNAEVVQAVAEFWESRIYAQPDPRFGPVALKDDNAATHLIRKAFGGDDPDVIARLLAIPSPNSRRYRDDITVTVIFLNE
ncbi:hypothetical protein IWQ60_005295 [Tieghemiomyces parasiticus]|uniref:PPM-type phosphatase domain-containing protein n=1 Tax=Tieghemiomyces parasiticus TaxID=78921 RepID=A0A9W8A783_9FUNG|nr:hypothetical protein IWQ60_005295 [Tieghemiomyces parasiticus]